MVIAAIKQGAARRDFSRERDAIKAKHQAALAEMRTSETTTMKMVNADGHGVTQMDAIATLQRGRNQPVDTDVPKWCVGDGGSVQWSTGLPVFSHHQGDRLSAQKQADKMNELGLGQWWEREITVEERNRIHEKLTTPDLMGWNYMD